MLRIILFVYLLQSFNCFSINTLHKPQINTINTINTINIINTPKIVMLKECKPSIDFITNVVPPDKHEQLVKSITSFLPKVDGIGGFVLHMNDVLINYILHVDLLSPNIKKSLILLIINISQMGDAAGHTILQYYYDLVDCLL